jgi:S-formylglutathione hydrolase FrmB
VLLAAGIILNGCNHHEEAAKVDAPRLVTGVQLRDVAFWSAALNRSMQYRAIFPAEISPVRKLPVLYLLHGGGGGFSDWSNYSDIASFAKSGMILIMPEGDDSYYTNSAERPQDRYEDYIANDLIKDVEKNFPVAPDREHRAIAGVSMGGFGAVNIALKHPELFAFAAGISPALDVPSRRFSIKRIGQWRHHESIFGAWDSDTRRNNDPFVLAAKADPSRVAYLFLSCGEQEGLFPSVKRFANLLAQRKFTYEFHAEPGGHNWNQWNERLPDLFASLKQHASFSDRALRTAARPARVPAAAR